MSERNYRNILFISLSQFGMAFSFNFVIVFMPFFIHKISPYSPQQTLLWIGFIMAATSFVAAIASTFWGSLASRFSPKVLYMRGLLSHAVLILLMGFVSSLPLLLSLRILQGVMGGISTVGLIIVSSSSSREYALRDIGFFQNSLTLGQLIGPPLGAFAASILGYRSAFLAASALIFITLVFCFIYVREVPREREKAESVGRKRTLNRKALIGWGLCFTTTIQLMFLPSVLPNVFQYYNIEHAAALKWAGLVVMFYTATAMVGTHLLCRLSSRIRPKRLIMFAGAIGVALQMLLYFSPGIIVFVAVRMLQTAMIAPIMPLIISLFTSELDGKVIGFLNSGRFAGNALGPMMATSVLAFAGFAWAYSLIAILALPILLAFTLFFRGADESDVIK
jgi:DHA1 family multidrug resistance protein-like MFS transporter